MSAAEDPRVIKLRSARRGGEPPEDMILIKLVNGLLDKTATQGELALIKSGMPIYQRGRSLVRPIKSEVAASRGRTTIVAGLANFTATALTDKLCQCAHWQKFDGRSKEWLRIDPPDKIAATILSRVGEWRFPQVAGVVTTPTLRPDGSLLTAPGYDAATRLYHELDPTLDLSGHVPCRPKKADAERALADLQYLLSNFPTVSEVDASVALSALISPCVRGAVSVMPMHAFRASTAGTGKTYLVDVASAIATGRPCPVATVAKSEEETEKRLGGLLLAAFPLICLDNVNGELGGDLLCQAIERPLVQIRPLGTSEIIEIESRATIFATGNALRVRGDMTRRSLICNLDAGVERPELRQFDFDPVEAVLSDRARYVGACLTIVLAHISAGFPGAAAPLASFADWSRYVRSAVLWLGCSDPCASMEQAREDDPELSELIDFIEAWDAEIGVSYAPTTAEVIRMVGERWADEDDAVGEWKFPRMREVLTSIGSGRSGIDPVKVAGFCRSREGRIVRNRKLRRAGKGHAGAVRWQLVKV